MFLFLLISSAFAKEAAVGTRTSSLCKPDISNFKAVASGICNKLKGPSFSDSCDHCKQGTRWVSVLGGWGNDWCCTPDDVYKYGWCGCWRTGSKHYESADWQYTNSATTNWGDTVNDIVVLDAANEAAVGAMKSCDVDGRTDPSSTCPGDQMCTCKNIYVGGGQQRPRCYCATPTLASAEASVGFSKDDANIWGAIEGEFSEKGENTGPATPAGTSHYLPGGADCRTHGQCKSGFCRRGTCTADDDWRNQVTSEIAVSSGSNGVPSQTAYYLANWNKNSCAWATGVQVMDEKQCLSGINSLGWGITKLGWTGNSGSVPKGCSFDPKSKKGHFNSHPTGHGRQDLRPLCKSKTYDDKCGCMYAYCEDKYGVGKTDSCCEFYRNPQSSQCRQMNSLAVTRDISSISSTTAVVYSFAALGFGFIMFGAAKHYLGAKTEAESMPFNEL